MVSLLRRRPLSFLLQTTLTLLGGALHCWTVLKVLWLGGGVVLSAVVFLLPALSETVVGAVSYRAEGFGSSYCVALLAYGLLMAANWLGLFLLAGSPYSEQ